MGDKKTHAKKPYRQKALDIVIEKKKMKTNILKTKHNHMGDELLCEVCFFNSQKMCLWKFYAWIRKGNGVRQWRNMYKRCTYYISFLHLNRCYWILTCWHITCKSYKRGDLFLGYRYREYSLNFVFFCFFYRLYTLFALLRSLLSFFASL